MKNIQISKISKFIVSAAEMKRCDGTTITHFKVPQEVLMERAALSLCDAVIERLQESDGTEKGSAVIFAGSGNNGGDGIAVARLLHQEGVEVLLITVNHSGKLSTACEKQLEIARNYGVKIRSFKDITDKVVDYSNADTETDPEAVAKELALKDCDVIIDAMLGIGCSRDLSGEYEAAVKVINFAADEGSLKKPFVVAADIPTGINADNGQICKLCVHADVTVTFGFIKLGLMLFPGSSFCGEIKLREVGITKDGFLGDMPSFSYIEHMPFEAMADRLLPKREPSGNKGSFGKVLVVAGSRDCSGAAIMCAESVLRSGAGMVRIFSERTNLTAIQTLLPEAMSDVYADEDVSDKSEEIQKRLIKAFDWADVIAAGCGLGTGESGRLLIRTILESCTKPLVLDADALNIIASDDELMNLMKGYPADKILTPHLAEFARLCKKSTRECKEQLLTLPVALAKEFHASIICKDARSIISDGDRNYINLTGNDGMATAGSGDVLTGLVAALLPAFPKASYEAAVTACYLHGAAGDLAASKNGKRAMTARDISLGLKEII